jgi:hypothetical protein
LDHSEGVEIPGQKPNIPGHMVADAALQKKRVIFFDSNKCNFLKHSKLVKFSQITLLNVNAQNEKIIFCLKIFKFNLKLWILKKEKN